MQENSDVGRGPQQRERPDRACDCRSTIGAEASTSAYRRLTAAAIAAGRGVAKTMGSAPKARIVKAWAIGPGGKRLRFLALKARHEDEGDGINVC